MSDSSEGEDMARFREAVDDSFVNNFMKSKDLNQTDTKEPAKPQKSERYLEVSGHYNDVQVPALVQRQIAEKVSLLIEKKIKFVDVHVPEISVPAIEGGVRLFTDSTEYLSSEDPVDTYTEGHNRRSRALLGDRGTKDVYAKVKSVVVTGAHVLSGTETRCWKSRRREKLFRYKGKRDGKVLTALDSSQN